MTAVLLFALWTVISLFLGVVVGQMIRRADVAEVEQDEAPAYVTQDWLA